MSKVPYKLFFFKFGKIFVMAHFLIALWLDWISVALLKIAQLGCTFQTLNRERELFRKCHVYNKYFSYLSKGSCRETRPMYCLILEHSKHQSKQKKNLVGFFTWSDFKFVSGRNTSSRRDPNLLLSILSASTEFPKFSKVFLCISSIKLCDKSIVFKCFSSGNT